MSILNKATTGRRGRAQRVVIYTPEGFGKSTLASLFPDPFSFDVESSTDQLEVRRLGRDAIPDLKTFESALAEVAKARPCASLSVDTIDWVEEMAAMEICAEHKVSNLEEVAGGYGKGYSYLTNRMSITLAKLDAVIAAGIHVVLLAHCSIVRFDPPDGAGAFDRYELKLYKDRKGGKGTASLIKEWADMLIFGNWRVQIAEKGKGDKTTYKGVGGRERLLFCNRTAAWDAKNRHGLADVEPWGANAGEAIKVFERAFKSVGAPWDHAPAVVAPVEPAAPKVAPPVVAAPVPPVADSKQSHPPVRLEHQLYKTSDDGLPLSILDRNGEVVLGLCKVCGRGESELEEDGGACPGDRSKTGDDEIPGIVNPPPAVPEVDAELDRICAPHGDAITSYLRDKKKITPAQTWQHMPAEFAAKIRKNPAAFLKHVEAAGKAVAA